MAFERDEASDARKVAEAAHTEEGEMDLVDFMERGRREGERQRRADRSCSSRPAGGRRREAADRSIWTVTCYVGNEMSRHTFALPLWRTMTPRSPAAVMVDPGLRLPMEMGLGSGSAAGGPFTFVPARDNVTLG